MDRLARVIRAFDSAAQSYQDRFMDVSRFQEALDRFCAAITRPDAEVLELACGPGNITHYLLQRRPDLRILGTDLAPNMLALARRNNPGATFELMDARALAALGRSFDAIVCGFCLPYFTPAETLAFVQDAATVLRPGGVLYVSTMEDDPARSGPVMPSSGQGEPVYMQYYEAAFLTEALHANGFTVLDLFREIDADMRPPTTDLVIVAQR